MRFLIVTLLIFSFLNTEAKNVNVSDFGAVGDGKTNDTKALQKAINACAESGGGRVTVGPGTYLTGTIQLKDNIDLHLMQNAVLLGVTDVEAYHDSALVLIKEVQNVTVSGYGKINGQGWHQNFNNRGRAIKVNRPFQIFVTNSKFIRITGIKLRNAPMWNISLKKSEWITIDTIDIYSHSNTNNDGIDIDAKNVVISNCIIDTDDDAIVFKSWTNGFVVENVSISNCRIASNCNAIKFGTWSAIGFRNISISNCVITSAAEDNVRTPWYEQYEGISEQPTVISGIALEVVDGGFIDGVTISNISMQGVQTPIFIRLGDRDGVGSLKNVLISNINATNESRITSSITGIPGSYVENVTIKDVIFNSKGTGTIEHANKIIPENNKGYPENRMYGASLPAHGFYVRHAKGIQFENFRLNLVHPDARPAVLFDDVHNASLRNIQADLPVSDQPLFRIIQSENIRFSNYHSTKTVGTLLSVEGEKTKKIIIDNNDFLTVRKPYITKDGASQKEVFLLGNLNEKK